MKALLDTPLTAAARHLDRPAIVAEASWTWRQMHAESLLLAERFKPGSTIFNLCASRFGFLAAWLAALRSRCPQMLPPSSGNTDLAVLLKSSASAVIVVDTAAAIQPWWIDHAECIVTATQPSAIAARQSGAPALDWSPDWDSPCVRLHTSGSTGQPQAQVKSLRQLAHGAQVLAARLDDEVRGGLSALHLIVCSVAPQHMFGLETSVMLPLITGVAVLDAKPLLPGDVRAAFDAAPGPAAWVTTPVHLRGLAQANQELPRCALALASTMPLASDLAARCESLADAPVLEIYGSTETGALGMRRTASQTRWRPLDGVRIEAAEDGSQAWGTHFTSPRLLADAVEICGDGSFELLGRQTDLIKIAGRRASLAGLNLLLHDMPGLNDGVFYLPATGRATERLVLIHAGALDKERARHWLRQKMDSAFVPRTFLEVDRLPRSEVGKLPRAALDAIYAAGGARSSQDSSTEAPASDSFTFGFCIGGDHPALAGHFPGRPVVPGVLLMDHVLREVRRKAGRAVGSLRRVKFTSLLLPGDHAECQCKIDGARVDFRVTTRRGGASIVLAQGDCVLCSDKPA